MTPAACVHDTPGCTVNHGVGTTFNSNWCVPAVPNAYVAQRTCRLCGDTTIKTHPRHTTCDKSPNGHDWGPWWGVSEAGPTPCEACESVAMVGHPYDLKHTCALRSSGDPPRTDLDYLEKLYAQATPKPWCQGPQYESSESWLWEGTHHHSGDPEAPDTRFGSVSTRDAILIVSMHEALPSLIAELRRLRAGQKGGDPR